MIKWVCCFLCSLLFLIVLSHIISTVHFQYNDESDIDDNCDDDIDHNTPWNNRDDLDIISYCKKGYPLKYVGKMLNRSYDETVKRYSMLVKQGALHPLHINNSPQEQPQNNNNNKLQENIDLDTIKKGEYLDFRRNDGYWKSVKIIQNNDDRIVYQITEDTDNNYTIFKESLKFKTNYIYKYL